MVHSLAFLSKQQLLDPNQILACWPFLALLYIIRQLSSDHNGVSVCVLCIPLSMSLCCSCSSVPFCDNSPQPLIWYVSVNSWYLVASAWLAHYATWGQWRPGDHSPCILLLYCTHVCVCVQYSGMCSLFCDGASSGSVISTQLSVRVRE